MEIIFHPGHSYPQGENRVKSDRVAVTDRVKLQLFFFVINTFV